MFSIEVKVNNLLVGHLYAKNKGYVLDYPELCHYSCRYYMPETGQVSECEVWHNREEGINELVRKVFNELFRK